MRLGEEHIFNNKSLTLITKKIMKKKNYFQPRVKLHELKAKNSMLAGSPSDIVQESRSIPVSDSDGDATQGFETIDGWN